MASDPQRPATEYVLGPDDQITILAIEPEEIVNKPMRIGSDGTISLPLIGRFKAAGLTVGQFEDDLNRRLKPMVKNPQVSVTVTEFRSQPVSVMGAVNTPGVQILRGRKTLMEVLSLSGGLRADAGDTATVVRSMKWGKIPLPEAVITNDQTVNKADIPVRSVLDGRAPERNIAIMPDDVISVPKADMVYVLGEVQKPGAYVLNDKERLSVLRTLALAGGLGPNSSPGDTKVIREVEGVRTEIPVNLKHLIAGKGNDPILLPKDVLFIPKSVGKRAAFRTLEAALQTATGLIIYRR